MRVMLHSLWQTGSEHSTAILAQVLLEELCELQEGRASGQGRALDQALLVEYK